MSRWVIHVWSDGGSSPWNKGNDEMFRRLYGTLPQPLLERECTAEELAEIEMEYGSDDDAG